ncbi:hypothetical protein JCM3765_007566 [Sporobolomyces pararoseus]
MASGLTNFAPGLAQFGSGSFFQELFEELDKNKDHEVQKQTERIKDWLLGNSFLNKKGEFDEVKWARLGHDTVGWYKSRLGEVQKLLKEPLPVQNNPSISWKLVRLRTVANELKDCNLSGIGSTLCDRNKKHRGISEERIDQMNEIGRTAAQALAGDGLSLENRKEIINILNSIHDELDEREKVHVSAMWASSYNPDYSEVRTVDLVEAERKICNLMVRIPPFLLLPCSLLTLSIVAHRQQKKNSHTAESHHHHAHVQHNIGHRAHLRYPDVFTNRFGS